MQGCYRPDAIGDKTENIQPDVDARTIWRRMRLPCEAAIGSRAPLIIKAG
jgi:hypothetical protein